MEGQTMYSLGAMLLFWLFAQDKLTCLMSGTYFYGASVATDSHAPVTRCY